jgi:hypothetical protein
MNKMYDEGGLATDGMDVDPVSGNDIPTGSNATDVRDDVDAKLSTGEYVVPADVVKYVGVAQLEKLVDKAKAGLEKMDDDGRIGGEPTTDVEEVTLGGDLSTLDGYATGGMVAGADIDGIINRVKAAAMKDPSILNMLKAKGIFVQEPQPQGQLQQQAMSQGAVPAQAAPPSMQGKDEPSAFAEGGLAGRQYSDYDPTDYRSGFNPYAYTPGFSAETSVTGQAPGSSSMPVAEPVCPDNHVWDPEQNMCIPVVAETVEPVVRNRSESNSTAPAANPNAWMDKYDYSRPDVLFEQTMTTLGAGSAKEDKGLVGSLLGLAGGALAGGVIGKFVSANNVAKASANAILLRESGRTASADKLDAAIAAYSKDKGVDILSDFTTGKRLAESARSVNQSNIKRWGIGAGADQVTDDMVQKGIEYAKKGDDRATEWEGQGPAITNSKNTSKKSTAAEFIKKATESGAAARQRAKDSADKAGRKLATGGRATGGLVGPRPSKTKTKPKGKRGLGSK